MAHSLLRYFLRSWSYEALEFEGGHGVQGAGRNNGIGYLRGDHRRAYLGDWLELLRISGLGTDLVGRVGRPVDWRRPRLPDRPSSMRARPGVGTRPHPAAARAVAPQLRRVLTEPLPGIGVEKN